MPVVATVTTVFFSLVGAEITTVAAAESKDPEKAVVRMATTITWRILLFYVVSLGLIVCVVAWPTIKPGESPFTLALNVMGFKWGSAVMSFIILTAVLSCLNSAVYVCSRVLYVMADRGDAPRWLVEVNSPPRARALDPAGLAGRRDRRVIAIVSPNRVFAFLISTTGTVILFVYLMTAFAHIRLRRRHPETETKAVRVWLFPWLSYVTIGAMVAVLIAMAVTPELASQFYFSLLTLAVVVGSYYCSASRAAAEALRAWRRTTRSIRLTPRCGWRVVGRRSGTCPRARVCLSKLAGRSQVGCLQPAGSFMVRAGCH